MRFLKIFALFLVRSLFFTGLTFLAYVSMLQQKFPPSFKQAKAEFETMQKVMKSRQEIIDLPEKNNEIDLAEFLKKRNQKTLDSVAQATLENENSKPENTKSVVALTPQIELSQLKSKISSMEFKIGTLEYEIKTLKSQMTQKTK